MNPLRLEVGLGKAERIVQVEILWLGSGTRQTVRELQLDHAYRIVEAEAQAKLIPLQRFHLPGGDHQHHHGHGH